MRILFLANNDVGLYQFRKELVEELLKEHKVMLALPYGERIDAFKEMGCSFIDTPVNRRGTNPMEDLKLMGFYKRILKETRPDMVFTYTIKPNVYGGAVCAGLGIPYVVNITGLGTAVENGGPLQKLTLTLYRYGLRKAQKVFFQNAENQDFMLRHHIIKGPYDLLPGSGVNLSRYQALDYPSEETIHFVFIARVMREKGIDQYLEAAKFIRGKYPHACFHVCGDCEQDYAQELDELQKAGVIIYHGREKDMMPIYRAISCTVHPTFYPEGLSNVLLESCACARPIITTNRAGCREVIDDGVNGFIVKERDGKDLIEKIERFLALTWEQRKNMGLAGRKKVEKGFDRNIVIEKYVRELGHRKIV